MYILELYQNNYSKDLVAFDSLEEGVIWEIIVMNNMKKFVMN